MAKGADADSGGTGAPTRTPAASVGRQEGEDARPDRLEDRPQGAGTGAKDTERERARILLVEDEPGIVDFVRRGFEADGFAVEPALDGVRGEELALSGNFDAIVLDLMLPGRDGWQVLAGLRNPDLPAFIGDRRIR